MGGAGTSSPGSLKGLGWLQSKCLADSLKGQSNKKQKKNNMQVSAFKIEIFNRALTWVMQAHLRGVH